MSLGGDLYLLDAKAPEKPRHVIHGHNKNITALSVAPASNNIYTGSYDGVVNRWDLSTATATPVSGKGHTNAVVQLHLLGNDLISVGMDDSLRVTPTGTLQYAADKVATDGQPSDVAVGKSGVSIVGTVNGVQVVRGGKVVGNVKLPDVTAVALSTDENTVAVGTKAMKIHLYSLSGSTLTQKSVLSAHRGAITRLAYSADSQYLASADTNREILVWPSSGGDQPKVSGWVFHAARVNDLAWSPDNIHLASVSLDQSIIIWNVNDISTRIQQKQAHVGGVNAVRWLDANTLVTVGQDSSAKTWAVKF